jgi:hypothetical protein
MILKKVALPLAVNGKSYLEAMILGITNNKFCSLRANFMQELFEQFQGKFYSIKTWKWFSDTNEIFIYGQEPYQESLRIFKELKSSDVWNILQDHWNLYQKKHYAREAKLRKNVRQVTKMTGKQRCQMEMRLMMLSKQVQIITHHLPEIDKG